ncbi:MAG: hypothetical protein ALECFALPRED_001168 [Alectoria fallacina]|uniref:Uncharacterized protein n=1 Tax=Alectoria fallacina TaxID=1903189 RepID=A0A8H3IL80_9LECA|nr:MAG: hypothetical protein ALECFALPRED_001168 [Alectoria fallacina]
MYRRFRRNQEAALNRHLKQNTSSRSQLRHFLQDSHHPENPVAVRSKRKHTIQKVPQCLDLVKAQLGTGHILQFKGHGWIILANLSSMFRIKQQQILTLSPNCFPQYLKHHLQLCTYAANGKTCNRVGPAQIDASTYWEK